jgi:hypothetical protein
LTQSQGRRKREEQDAKQLRTLVVQRWCDLNTVETDVRPGDSSEESARELCIGDVKANGGRAPAGSKDQHHSENGLFLIWQHAHDASAAPFACGCTVDGSHQNARP